MTVIEAAQQLQVSPAYIRKLIGTRRLKAERIGERLWWIEPEALAQLHVGPVGRPRKVPRKLSAVQKLHLCHKATIVPFKFRCGRR